MAYLVAAWAFADYNLTINSIASTNHIATLTQTNATSPKNTSFPTHIFIINNALLGLVILEGIGNLLLVRYGHGIFRKVHRLLILNFWGKSLVTV
jgi:hypothetical protein